MEEEKRNRVAAPGNFEPLAFKEPVSLDFPTRVVGDQFSILDSASDFFRTSRPKVSEIDLHEVIRLSVDWKTVISILGGPGLQNRLVVTGEKDLPLAVGSIRPNDIEISADRGTQSLIRPIFLHQGLKKRESLQQAGRIHPVAA